MHSDHTVHLFIPKPLQVGTKWNVLHYAIMQYTRRTENKKHFTKQPKLKIQSSREIIIKKWNAVL